VLPSSCQIVGVLRQSCAAAADPASVTTRRVGSLIGVGAAAAASTARARDRTRPGRRRIGLTTRMLCRTREDLAARWEHARGELSAYANQAGGTLRLRGFASSFPRCSSQRCNGCARGSTAGRPDAGGGNADSSSGCSPARWTVAITQPNLGGPTRTTALRAASAAGQPRICCAFRPSAGRPVQRGAGRRPRATMGTPRPHSCDQLRPGRRVARLPVSPPAGTSREGMGRHVSRWWPMASGVFEPRPVPVSDVLPVAQVTLRSRYPRPGCYTATRGAAGINAPSRSAARHSPGPPPFGNPP